MEISPQTTQAVGRTLDGVLEHAVRARRHVYYSVRDGSVAVQYLSPRERELREVFTPQPRHKSLQTFVTSDIRRVTCVRPRRSLSAIPIY